MNKKGFSLLEIIIVVAILGVLSAIVVNSFHSAQLKKQQESITQGLLASIEKQKADTQAGKGGSNYGIKFNSDSYILYKGKTYSEASLNNQEVSINPQFILQYTLSDSSDRFFFSKLYGEASQNATVTISHLTNELTPQVILVEKSGTISVIE